MHNKVSSIRNFKARTVVYSCKTMAEKRLKIELCALRKPLKKEEIQSVTWVNSSECW